MARQKSAGTRSRSSGRAKKARAAIFLRALAASIFFLAMNSCSSLPAQKGEPESTVLRSQAVSDARLGDESMNAQNWAQAETYYRQALEIQESVDNLAGQAASHNSLGFLYLSLSKYDAADSEFAAALDLATQAGDKNLGAQTLVNQAKVLIARGSADKALPTLDQASSLAGSKPEPGLLAGIEQTRGTALRDLGRYDEARKALQDAVAINVSRKVMKELAANYYMLASVEFRGGSGDKSLPYLSNALDLDQRAENSTGIAADLFALATVSLARADAVPAQAASLRQNAWNWLRRSFAVSLAINDADAVARTLGALVDLAAKLGKESDRAHYADLLGKLKH